MTTKAIVYERILYDLHFEYRQGADKKYYYVLMSPVLYYSPRYRKQVALPAGMISDGASGPAPDLASLGWWVHDKLCSERKWADGSICTAFEASAVLHDILLDEGRKYRARTWGAVTYLWQKARGHK